LLSLTQTLHSRFKKSQSHPKLMKITQLDHMAVHAEDVAASCAFYEKALKLETIPRPDFNFPGAWYKLGETQELHIIGERTDPITQDSRGDHFALAIDDMDAWEAHLQAVGIEYLPRRTRPDGAHQIYVVDPDGHYIELCQPPK